MNVDGVFLPIPTPFLGHELDTAALGANVDRWMTTPVRGIVALGSNGEAPLVDEAESDRVIATVREHVPSDRLVFAGTGRESTVAAVDASKRAAGIGADAVLVRTPSYFKGQLTSEAFVRHYRRVADASPVPVILYNFTAVTGVTLPVSAVVALAEHPNIIGMKESGADMGYVGSLLDETPDDFQVLVGSAPTFYAALLLGAGGGILALACVVPGLCVELHRLVRAKRLAEARALQCRLVPLARLVTRTHGVPGLKAALSLLGYTGGEPRSPLFPVSEEAVEDIRTALQALDVEAGVSVG